MTSLLVGHDSTTLYHIGTVVPDIHAAIEQNRGALGMRFTDVREMEFPAWVDGKAADVVVLAAFSADGPPYLELIEERPGPAGPIWSAPSMRLNHLGYWAHDMPTTIAWLESRGMPARIRHRSDPPIVTYHETASGVWIELVNHRVMHHLVNEWITSAD
jgi:hypothetical protein